MLKNIVERPRPIGYRLIDETGYSFPSGHSMASAAFYGFFIYLIFKRLKNKKIKLFKLLVICTDCINRYGLFEMLSKVQILSSLQSSSNVSVNDSIIDE